MKTLCLKGLSQTGTIDFVGPDDPDVTLHSWISRRNFDDGYSQKIDLVIPNSISEICFSAEYKNISWEKRNNREDFVDISQMISNCNDFANRFGYVIKLEDSNMKKNDRITNNIEHPEHYKTAGGGDLMPIVGGLNFPRGNAIKYIYRAGRKEGESELQDLKKAAFYLNYEIERLSDKK